MQRLSRTVRERLIQLAYTQLPEPHQTLRVMPLKGNGTGSKAFGLLLMIISLSIFIHHFTINGNSHLLSLHLDIVGKPLIILMRSFPDILEAVNACRFTPITMSGVYLGLIPDLRPSVCLVGTVEENAGIGTLRGLHLALKLKVLELRIAVLAVKHMCPGAKNLDGTSLNGKCLILPRYLKPYFFDYF